MEKGCSQGYHYCLYIAYFYCYSHFCLLSLSQSGVPGWPLGLLLPQWFMREQHSPHRLRPPVSDDLGQLDSGSEKWEGRGEDSQAENFYWETVC